MKINHCIYIFICAAMACASNGNRSKNGIERVALAFSEAYFNYDFKKASKYVTDGSVRWLNYAASNMTQEDIDMLRSMDESATVVVDSSSIKENPVVYITVSNFMMKDSIGKRGCVVSKGHFCINVTNDGKWEVRLDGLPQSVVRDMTCDSSP